MKHFFYLILFISCVRPAMAQTADEWLPVPGRMPLFIKSAANTFAQQQQLDAVLKKLQAIQHSGKGQVNIIHIGDSHMQGDGITSVVRNGFQQYFGNAGRGLVFPYQLARTNAPHDIGATSATTWKNNRVTNVDAPLKAGLCGYAIETDKEVAAVRLYLKEIEGIQEYFNRMRFFLGKEAATYRLTDSNIDIPPILVTKAGSDTPSIVYETANLLTGFELSRQDGDAQNPFRFYGVSLERKDSSGVLYHTIGANGARYDQYLASPLFWQQLRALHGDLFIVSMGTNEAQNPNVNVASFQAICDSFVRQIRHIAPQACIVLTTPAGSYYRKKKPNASLQPISHALMDECKEKNLSCWDLYTLTGGKMSAINLKKAGLLGTDLVHYNNEGYALQGRLLLAAFASAYNQYTAHHIYKAPAKGPAPQPATPRAREEKPAPPTYYKTVKDTIIPIVKQPMPAADSLPTRKSNIKVGYMD